MPSSSTLASSTVDIAVVGGGLSGLVLARTLQEHGVASTVYELDATADARRQGGLLDLHVESGQAALRTAGLYERFRRLTRPQAEAMRVMDKAGTVFIDQAADDGSGEGGRPEIDRTELRALLLDSLHPGRVVWDHKLSRARRLDDGRFELVFADGSRRTADLLIGADGAWSRVRPLVSDASPEYAGISYVDFRVTDAPAKVPASAALVGTGSLFALSDNKNIGGHGGRDLHLGAMLRTPEDWIETRGVDWSDVAAVRACLLAEFADWTPALTDLIRHCDDEITARRVHALPIGHAWPRVPGVTLVGDAAHLMSPFAGEGANAAMYDARELALALIEHGADVESALHQYETAMFPRATDAARKSARGLDLCFADDSPRGLVEFFDRMSAHAAPSH
ncbi:FAD-dependent monooxygenase [Streptomyces sp. NBC_01283]|uniref:FAD-dependent oxidoreductase n=1 Tax=Streptomyces sp. NBC_01283 TaxID=2903812 RepID=UPI00352F6B87|nr:FAD-dependent monooxygenase [Streptomyces sp. NBC_01283]